MRVREIYWGMALVLVALSAYGQPVMSPAGGFQTTGVSVTITNSSGYDIRYTLDGNVPESTSTLYTGPISVTDTTVIRAREFVGINPASDTVTECYIFNPNTTLPVIALVLDPNDLWNPLHFDYPSTFYPDSGIYWWSVGFTDPVYGYLPSDGERTADVTYWLPDGTEAFHRQAGMRMQGNASRTNSTEKKSFRLYFDSAVHPFGRLEYPMFSDTNVDRFDKLVLRAGYNDGWAHGHTWDDQAQLATYVRDEITRNLREEMGDLAVHGSYCTLYFINGDDGNPNIGELRPWGLYNLTERLDDEFLQSYTGKDNWDIIQFQDDPWENPDPNAHTPDNVEEGDATEWNNLINFFRSTSTNFANQSQFDQLAGMLDVDNWTNYLVLNIWNGNCDWPHTNGYAYRERTTGAKWRFLDWDAESTYGGGGNPENGPPFVPGAPKGRDVAYDSIKHMTRENLRMTILFRKMLANTGYRDYFCQQMDKYLNTTLQEANIISHMDTEAANIRGAVPFEETWPTRLGNYGLTAATWESALVSMENWINGRTQYVRQHIRDNALFPNVTGWADVTLTAPPGGGGDLEIQTIEPDAYPWTGTFFTGVPMTIEAKPDPGFRFVRWSDDAEFGATRTFTFASAMSVTAVFAPDPSAPVLESAAFGRRDLIELTFDRDLDTTTAENPANYSVDNGIGAPQSATLKQEGRKVILEFAAPLSANTTYTVSVINVKDASFGIAIPSGTPKTAQASFASAPSVAITEIMYNNRGEDIEWIELGNLTGSPVDISGWYITDSYDYPFDVATMTEGYATIPAGTTLAAGEYAVINLWGDASFTNWQMPVGVRVINANSSDPGQIGDGGDNLALYTAATGGTLVDGSLSIEFPDLATDGDSLERIDPAFPWGAGESDRYNWRRAAVQIGHLTAEVTPGVYMSDHASPGRANGTGTADQYTVSASSGANGSVSPSGVSTVNHGDELRYVMTPDEGYMVADVLVDSVSVGAEPRYLFKDVLANHTISATFTPAQHTVWPVAGTGGTISPSTPVAVSHGGSRTFTITPDVNCLLDSLYVDGVSVTPASSYTFTNVTSMHTIEATFVSLTVDDGAFSAVPTNQWLIEGERLELTAELAAPVGTPTYEWFRNDVSVGTGATLVIDPVLPTHTGMYVCQATDASKTIYRTSPISIRVFPIDSVPVVGGVGLAALFAGCVTLAIRRNRKRS